MPPYTFRSGRAIAILVAALVAVVLPLGLRPAHAASSTLVISEVDYDQPSTDSAEFIEVFNVTRSTLTLNNYALILFNGDSSPAQEYARITLSGKLPPRSILTVGSSTMPFLLPGGYAFLPFPGDTDQIQNGPADGIALVNLATFGVIDALAYEGAVPAAQIAGGPIVNLGPSLGTDDGAVADTSLFRPTMDLDTDTPSDWRLMDATPHDENCHVLGTAGADAMVDRSGDANVLCGGAGNDSLIGLDGSDLLIGGAGNDIMAGGRGNDVLDGRSGSDTAAFHDSGVSSSVTVDLIAGTATNATLGEDFLVRSTLGEVDSIENVKGSPFDDMMIGDAQRNVFEGNSGDDEIHGGDGPDLVRGGEGSDLLFGEGGDDRMQPGMGDDEVSGGAGANALDYGDLLGTGPGQNVDLVASTSGGFAGQDTVSGFASVYGSWRDDILTARLGGVASVLLGGAGADLLAVDDGDGMDLVFGGDGTDHCLADGSEVSTTCEG